MSLWFSVSLSVAVMYHLPPLTEADDANAHAAEWNPLSCGRHHVGPNLHMTENCFEF